MNDGDKRLRLVQPTRFQLPAYLTSAEYLDEQDERAAQWEREQRQMQREQQLVARRGRLVGASQLGLKRTTFAQLVAGRLDKTPALGAVHAWMSDPDAEPFLVLTGGVGAGKTVAAAYFLVNHATAVLWTRPWPLVRMFDAHYGPLVEERYQHLHCPALVVDDLGIEDERDKMRVVLLDLLEHRKSARTLITTNLEAAELAARYSTDRIDSRLGEGLVRIVGCGAQDLRLMAEHQGG